MSDSKFTKVKSIKNKNKKGFMDVICEREKVFINLHEVLYIERNTRKVRIVAEDVEYMTYESLNSLIGRLPDNFIRCHTGYIVNMNYVKSIHTNYLVLKNDMKISIGRAYKGALS